jgi:mRNA-degrading endonuclease RelE of RelBE toxin-antitoxin system
MLEEMIPALGRVDALISDDDVAPKDLPNHHTMEDLIRGDTIQRADLPLDFPAGASPSEIWLPDPELLGDVDVGDLESEVDEHGIDCIAWYRSFRNQDPTNRHPWGIYVTMRGVALLARWIRMYEGDVEPYLYRLKRAFDALYWHEFHHFKTDLGIGTCELISGRPIFKTRSGFGSDRYLLDEALCNAYALDRAEAPTEWLTLFNRDQPPGYQDGPEWKGRRSVGYRRLVMLYQGNRLGYPLGVEGIFNSQHRTVSTRDVPLWIVAPPASPEVFRLVTSISRLVETKRFKEDLQKLDRVVRDTKWPRTRTKLAAPFADPGLQFKKLKGWPNVFRARVDRSYRVTLRPSSEDSVWELLRIGPHDELDRRPV